MKASRPSSSSLRISTSTPAASPMRLAASSAFFASRIAAVATIRIASAPSSSASRTCVATTSAISSIFSSVIRALALRVLLEARVGALLHHLAQLSLLRLGNEHARGVRPDVDRGAEHASMIADHAVASVGRALARAQLRDRLARVRGVWNSRKSPVTMNATCSPMSTRVVADALDRAGDEDHRHRPLAAVVVVADLERDPEDLLVEVVDDVVLADEVAGHLDVAVGERPLCLRDLGPAPACPSSRRP